MSISIADERRRWRTETRITEYLHRFGLDENLPPQAASGGEAKRAALALALALEPDLLLLDEPTNNLDIDGILQLENSLLRQPAAIVVTHERAFLDRVTTRILELDRGMLRSYAGNFSDYERIKQGELAAEAVAQRKFDRFWTQEEAWIRKGIEARRTRNEGRVRRLEKLRAARAARRSRAGNLKLNIGAGQRSGKLVAELTKVTKTFGGRPIVRDLDLIVSRGDRIGLIGPNGSGKTTLLKLILGTLLLVSHDRAFLDNVVTQTVAAEGGGLWREYAGGYSDYLRQRPAPANEEKPAAEEAPGPRERTRVKLSYKETRELEALPGEIEALEAEQKDLYARMHAPEYYRQPPDVLRNDQQRSAAIERLLIEKLERWEALEAKAKAAAS